MLEIGATLKAAREQRGASIDDASEATKIRVAYLLALEEEEVERLPGLAYARGFLRSYSDYLGLDTQLLVDEFSERYSAAPWEIDADVMFPRRRGPRPSRRPGRESGIVIVALAGIVAVTILVVIASTYPSTRATPLPDSTSATSVVTVTEVAVNPVATAVTADAGPDSTSVAAQAVVMVKALAQVTLTVRSLGAPASAVPIFQRKLNPNPAQPDGIRLPKSSSGYLIRLDRANTITLMVNGSPVVPGPTDLLLAIDPNGRVSAVTG